MCGRLRFELQAAPLLAYACHCHDCQTRSGSAFALTLVVRTEDLELRGAPDVALMASPSGRELEHSFCPECRVRLFVRATAAMDYASLRAGVLDDASWVEPIAQMYVESAVPWAVIPGVESVPPERFDFYALGERWRAGAPEFRRAGI